MTDPRKQLICDEAQLRDHDFSGAILQGVSCMDACFDGSSFHGADLYWAIAMGASFRDCDLTDTILCGADLKDTSFAGAKLIRTDFGRDNLGGATQLQGADLGTAIIQSSRFEGAQYDSQSKFPRGFDPDNYGLQFRERA